MYRIAGNNKLLADLNLAVAQAVSQASKFS